MIIATLYDHYSKVPDTLWRWPNFQPSEIACSCCQHVMLHYGALDCLQELRTRLNRPLIVNSSYRCPRHNQAVNGHPASRHVTGEAFDLAADGDHDEIRTAALGSGFKGIGTYVTFVHVDVGDRKDWRG
jgi:uncharacterized protein YcbK (DUF882 family)